MDVLSNVYTSETDLHAILKFFKIDHAELNAFGSGLINRTWKAKTPSGSFILQRVNDQVFRFPTDIAHNIDLIANYLKTTKPGYFLVAPLPSVVGRSIEYFEGAGWFRVMPFVENSFSFDVVETSAQAYEAARTFGRFTTVLAGFDTQQLKITIPDFHNLALRYEQFLASTRNGNKLRISESKKTILQLLEQKQIVGEFQSIITNPGFKLRVTHHDTKISNVLFDDNHLGTCVIDLDTVMPGYFISDVGDMMRTYLSPFGEEETDIEKITVRPEFYRAIVTGYLDEMKNVLTDAEKEYFLFSGKFMIYMQALRFMTDYLSDDVYYGARYERHNLTRARNQLTLLRHLIEQGKDI